MNAPCKTCDRQTATHRATNPRETDRRYRTWLICRRCIRQAIAHGVPIEIEPLLENEVGPALRQQPDPAAEPLLREVRHG